MKAINKRFSALCLLLALCLCVSAFLSACSNEGRSESHDSYEYRVKVVTEGGMPLENVKVKVFNRGNGLVHAGYTDEEGSLEFTSEQGGLNAVISEVPDGYKYDASYPLTENENKLTVKTFFLGNDITGKNYQLGDIVDDFSVVDVDGNTYKVSELLKTKKAVVLNLWFENCGPCRMEFPYLNEAYNDYKDKLEILAISPVDSKNAVSKYKTQMELDFPMVSGSMEWESAFVKGGYPTTVVIDRYGMVAMIHSGAVTDKETFVSVFEYFTKDDYKQTVIKNLSELR